MSTNSVCFGSKIRKLYTPVYPSYYYVKVGYKGVYIKRTCHHDVRPICPYDPVLLNLNGLLVIRKIDNISPGYTCYIAFVALALSF